MKKLILILALAGCTADLLGPEDPRCEVWIAEGQTADITRWQMDHCRDVRINVVHFQS